jgi:hypothetical protein
LAIRCGKAFGLIQNLPRFHFFTYFRDQILWPLGQWLLAQGQ